jgi:hypothetical protein
VQGDERRSGGVAVLFVPDREAVYLFVGHTFLTVDPACLLRNMQRECTICPGSFVGSGAEGKDGRVLHRLR